MPRTVKQISLLALAGALVASGPTMAQTGLPAADASADTQAQPAQIQDQRPNVLVWMMDDVGFAQLSCFGGLVSTPNIDRVARMGTRYANFHTTPVCSPSRAALLTGRNSHTVNMGAHNMFTRDLPGYNGHIPRSAGTLAENLRQGGYTTFALGKWDHLPIEDTSAAGPFTFWPEGQGFDKFYGFMASETDNFHPLLWRGNTPFNPPADPNYHLNNDLADQAIAMIRGRDAHQPEQPFLVYWATGTAHAPHHAPQSWIERYRGKFDMGWDEARQLILQRQIADGIVPQGTKLAPRPDGMPAWASLTAAQKRLYARQMEVFAAALSHADEQFGRILDELDRRGELENTIIVIVSDNGASAEGGPTGTYNELLFATNALPDDKANTVYLDRWGGPQTYPHYAFGWAVAGNTPNRYYKQTTYEGGIRVPLIISTPHEAEKGAWRHDFVHVSDIVPTVLDFAGVEPAKVVNDVPQSRFDGISIAYTLGAHIDGPQSREQYFEMFGHRGFLKDGWKIVAPSRLDAWNITASGKHDSAWQLYDVRGDQGETTDLAARRPEKLAELEQGFDEQAKRFGVYPIGDFALAAQDFARRSQMDFERRQGEWRFSGPVSRVPKQLSPPFARGNFSARVNLNLPSGNVTGPVFVEGGHFGGIGLYLSGGRPRFQIRTLDGQQFILAAQKAIAAGAHDLELEIRPSGNTQDKVVTLRIDNTDTATGTLTFAIPATVEETFDIGRDEGTALSDDYQPNQDFEGAIREVTFDFVAEPR